MDVFLNTLSSLEKKALITQALEFARKKGIKECVMS
jgi:hypothetical protein